ncbi:MAG: hypothetical protein AAFV53_02150 [Myxococcota bacterium]
MTDNKHSKRIKGWLENYLERAEALKTDLEALQAQIQEIADQDKGGDPMTALKTYPAAQAALSKLGAQTDPLDWTSDADEADEAIEAVITEIEEVGGFDTVLAEMKATLTTLEDAADIIDDSGLEDILDDTERLDDDVKDITDGGGDRDETLDTIHESIKKITDVYGQLSDVGLAKALRGVLSSLHRTLGQLNEHLKTLGEAPRAIPEPPARDTPSTDTDPPDPDVSTVDESEILAALKSIRIHLRSILDGLGGQQDFDEWLGASATAQTQLTQWASLNKQLQAPDDDQAAQYDVVLKTLTAATPHARTLKGAVAGAQAQLTDVTANQVALQAAVGQINGLLASLSTSGDRALVQGLLTIATINVNEIRGKLTGQRTIASTPKTGGESIQDDLPAIAQKISRAESGLAQEQDPTQWRAAAAALLNHIEEWITKNQSLPSPDKGEQMIMEAKRTLIKKLDEQAAILIECASRAEEKAKRAESPDALTVSTLETEINALDKLYTDVMAVSTALYGEATAAMLNTTIMNVITQVSETQTALQKSADQRAEEEDDQSDDGLYQKLMAAAKEMATASHPQRWQEQYVLFYDAMLVWVDAYTESNPTRATELSTLNARFEVLQTLSEEIATEARVLQQRIDERPKDDAGWDNFRPYVKQLKDTFNLLKERAQKDSYAAGLEHYTATMLDQLESDLEGPDPIQRQSASPSS